MSFLQIGSWNIEHLSARQSNRQSAYALADHIEMAGLQILVLQEVYVTYEENGERRNEDIDLVVELLEEHLGTTWEYEIYPNRQAGDKSQLCGVLWDASRINKTAVKKIDVPHSIDGYATWDRAPHAVRFTVGVDRWRKDSNDEWVQQRENSSLILIPLHMKSNFGGESRARRVREREAKSLVARLDDVISELEDDSLILIGDTNCLDRNEPALDIITQYGLRDLNAADTATYPGYGGAPFDRAFVAEDRREFRYSRQYVLQSSNAAEHDRFLSDHYMIKLSVKIYVDDADPRDFV